MASIAVTTNKVGNSPPKRNLRYRFRKAWRAVFFLALIPFFFDGIIPGANQAAITFVSGAICLIPLATFIEVVTEDLIERLGQLLGGLLHAFFGNTAFFVLTVTILIQASRNPERAQELVTVVQSSIAGTIVVDILFILGISIFIGGLRHGRMQFSQEYSNQYAEMLTVAVIALALPSLASKLGISVGLKNSVTFVISPSESGILSDMTAIILIIAYVGYLGWTVFKFRDKPAKVHVSDEDTEDLRGDLIGPLAEAVAPIEEEQQRQQMLAEALVAVPTLHKGDVAVQNDAARQIINERLKRQKELITPAQEEAKERSRGIALWELAILILGTAGVVFISDRMAGTLEQTLNSNTGLGLNSFFVGFIIIPIASNIVELSASVNTAWHDRMETCLAVTAGSAIQIALLIAPALVLVGHIVGLGQMNLIFGLFILGIFALIAYLFQLITIDGETTWLEGLQFLSFFAVIAVVAFLAGK